MSGELFEIFQPGARYLREERERLELTIETPGDGAPPFGIDMEAGVALVTTEDLAGTPRDAST